MNEVFVVAYLAGILPHFVCSLVVCSFQKQPTAVRWCIVPVVSVLWPIFFLRMAWSGYDRYMAENTKDENS